MKIYNLKPYLDKRKSNNKKVYSFGSAVKMRRLQLQLTLAELADKDISISYISKVENNQIIPSLEKRLLIEERLQLKDLFMTPEHFDILTEQWLLYLYKQDENTKETLISHPIEENHYGLFHKFLLSETIKPEINMSISELFDFFNAFSDENIALILLITAMSFLRKSMSQQAYDIIKWLDINDYSDLRYHYLYYAILIEISFDCHKVHMIEKYFQLFLETSIMLQNMNKVNEMRDKVNALLVIYDAKHSVSSVQERYVNYVKYFLNQNEKYVYDESHNVIHSIIFAYSAKIKNTEFLELAETETTHIVFEYIALKKKHQTDELIVFIREMLISQPISQYDYLTIHFLLNDAILELVNRHFYKEAMMLSQKLIITSNILKRA